PSAFARSMTSRGLVLLPDFVSIAINTLLNPGFDELVAHPINERRAGSRCLPTNPDGVFMCGPHDWRYPQGRIRRAMCTRRSEAGLAPPHVLSPRPRALA